jgi:hypothetical protein
MGMVSECQVLQTSTVHGVLSCAGSSPFPHRHSPRTVTRATVDNYSPERQEMSMSASRAQGKRWHIRSKGGNDGILNSSP